MIFFIFKYNYFFQTHQRINPMGSCTLKGKIVQEIIRNPYFIKITFTICLTVLFYLFNKLSPRQFLVYAQIFQSCQQYVQHQ